MLATTLLATGVVPPPAAPGSARAALKERVSTSVARALTDAAATSLAGLRTRLAPGSPSIFAATLELGSKGPHPVPSLAAIQASVSVAVRAAVDAASAVPSWADADPESGTGSDPGPDAASDAADSGSMVANSGRAIRRNARRGRLTSSIATSSVAGPSTRGSAAGVALPAVLAIPACNAPTAVRIASWSSAFVE